MFSDRRMSVARNLLISTTSTFVVVIALVLFTALAFGFVSAIFGATNTYAASTASITTSGTVNIDVSASGNSASIGTDNVEVITDCAAGYTLYIGGSNDNTLYKDGDSSNNNTNSKISPSSGTIESPKPIIGDDGNGHSYLNTWGYSITADTTISSNSFIGLTNSINAITTKNSATTGDTIPVYYGVSVGPSTEAGSYSLSSGNTITYYLTMNDSCLPYTIKYNGNYIDSATGKDIETGIAPMSIKHESLGSGDEVTLVASNFRNDGYGFAGWSTTKLDPESSTFATDLQAAVNEHKVFGPNETITLDSNITQVADHDHVITLYAVWIKVAGAMQDWKGCNAMNVGEVTALYDARDDNVYAVAKLADNNCWMIENFRLDSQSTVGNNFKDPTVTNESLAQGYAKSIDYGNFVGLAISEEYFGNNSTVNSLYSVDADSGKVAIGASNAGYRFPRYNNTNTSSSVSDMTAVSDAAYSYGNYYNWAAAIASTAVDSNDSVNVYNTSICPTGWHLPYGGDTDTEYGGNTSGGFYYLGVRLNAVANNTASAKVWTSYPNNFIRAGYRSNEAIMLKGNSGRYVSTLAPNISNIRVLNVSTSGLGAGTNGSFKYNAFSVRCIASGAYTVVYDANGGSGNMDNQVAMRDKAVDLDTNAFTNDGHYFTGWNTAADGSGISYTDGQKVTNLANIDKTITLYAQWTDCPPNNICYDDNGANSNTTMSNQDIAGVTNVTLWASNFKYDGHGFAGWSTKPIEPTDGLKASDVSVYGPNETIEFENGKYNNYGLKLYAVWIEPKEDNGINYIYMQEFGGGGLGSCDDLEIGEIVALIDRRDSQVYTVAKLADNKCWMMDNLRLNDVQPSGEAVTLGAFDTNKPLTVDGAVSIKNFDGGTSNHLSSSINPGVTNWCTAGTSSICIDQSMLFNENTVSPASSMTTSDNNTPVYNYGNYYNWYSATAGRGTYDIVSASTVGDICPYSWHLPTAGSISADFGNLDIQLGGNGDKQDTLEASNRWRKFPQNFTYAGHINGTLASRGAAAHYWSSTASDVASAAYSLVLSEDQVRPGNANNDSDISSQGDKYLGRSVRCVANQ